MFLAVMGFITISAQYAAAQTPDSAATTTTVTETPAAITNPADLTSQDETPIHQQLKTKFIECHAGHVEMEAYSTGILLKKMGVVSGFDSTTEAAVAKLFFLLGLS